MAKDTKIRELPASKKNSSAGKYLTFNLNDEQYGLKILKVHEIIGMLSITYIPKMPEFMQGVINLRGQIIPVINLRKKFGMNFLEYNERTCIVVVQISRKNKDITMGIIVDDVDEVLDINQDQIEEAPDFGVTVNTDFIWGIGKIGRRVVTLLNLDYIFNEKDISLTEQAVKKV